MKLFIYTRTYKDDYRLIASPNESYLPENILWAFIAFSRDVINIENPLYGDFKLARWSIYKYYDYVLFGIGCKNIELSEHSNDKVGRPVRGFFGVVLKLTEETNILPFDLQYFKDIYRCFISPHWEERNFMLNDIDCLLDISRYNHLPPSNMQLLNNMVLKTKFFQYNNKLENYLASCLNYSICNIVTGINVEEHAIEAGFMNALSFDTIEEKIVDNSKKKEQLTSQNKVVVTKEKKIQNNNILSGSSKHLMKNIIAQAIETLNPFSSSKSQRHFKNQEIDLNIEDSNSKISRVTINDEPILTTKDTDDENIELLRQAYKENKLNKNAQEGAFNTDATIDIRNDMLSLKNNVAEKQEQINIDSFDIGLMRQNINTTDNFSDENTSFDDLQEITPGKQISEKYREILSELKSSISSIDDYSISSEKYIEIEGLVKELITKIKS
ncbi:MAG: hypothetical protein LWX70_00130 [Sphingobacteriia bacterium]|nr:hypothetical protein [Sphingobacteriia bacterium]